MRSPRATRSTTFPHATAETHAILLAARVLLAAARPAIEQRGLTLLGVSVANVDDDRAVQLRLPLDRHAGSALDAAVDGVRDRFGDAAITRGVLVGCDPGPTMPLLPD